MPLPIFDKVEDIPEAFRPEYVEREGKWHPNVEDVSGLKNALEAQKTEARTAKQKAKDLEDQIAAAAREADAKKTGITDEQLNKLREEDAAKRKPLEEEAAALKAENRKMKLDDKVRAAALAKGVMPERLEAAMRDLQAQNSGKGRFDLTDQGTLVVLDIKGNPTSEPIDAFFETTYAKEADWYYAGTGSSGGGSRGSTSGGAPLKGKTADQIAADLNAKRAEGNNPLITKPAKVGTA